MTPPELLEQLARLDIRLTPAGDKLRVDAPKGVLTPELVSLITEHKPQVLALLSAASAPPHADAGERQENRPSTSARMEVLWSHELGRLLLKDPGTAEWYEVKAVDVPRWSVPGPS